MNKASVILIAIAVVLCSSASQSRATASNESSGPTIVRWDLSAAQVRANCTAAIRDARQATDALAGQRVPPTFANTVLRIEDINADLNDRLVAEMFLSQVSPEKNVRDASVDCTNAVAAFNADALAVPAIYQALARIAPSSLRTDADRKLLEVWKLAYERSGAALPARERVEFVALSKELALLQTQYDQNYANDATTISVATADTDGMPSDFVSSLKKGDDGQLILPVNDSNVRIVLENAQSEALRRQYYMAYFNIQVPANLKLLKEAIGIRYRLAHLLGYTSWAQYQMAVRTVTQPAQIRAFLSSLDVHLKSKAGDDIERLAAIKASETGNTNAKIEIWDVQYYLRELQKTSYALDPDEVRQYFPAQHVVDAVLAIYQHLLGVTFTPVKPANSWYPGVIEYEVSDTATGAFIGTFLLDLYPRAGKPGGAFNTPILPIRQRPDGTWRAPISAIIVSDWPAPLNGKPALLTHTDVTTFFHEFGHCMAALLTKAPYESLTSFGQDFIEAPSQMLENFTWDPSILKRLSSNVTTGEPLPDTLISKMIAARCTSDRLCNAYAATRQVMLSDIDLKYHEGSPNVDLDGIWAQTAAADTPMGLPAGVHPAGQFTHIMSGYDAGYYVYLWSLVYAQDMFTAFQQGGLDNPSVGERYRRTILEPAYIYDADTEVRNFLGRPMSPAAFYAGFDHEGSPG